MLRSGREVRTTVRSMAREADLRAAIRRGGADPAGLAVVVADLLADDGWQAAVAGCAEVHHVASPFPVAQPERAAWDLMAAKVTELVVVNPTGIFGPTLSTTLSSSAQLIKAMLERAMEVLPRQRFGVVDVRDVADLHLRAMASAEAAGKRFLAVADGPSLSYAELAEILGVPAPQAPGEDPPRPIIHNTRARTELGWRPRPAETAIVQTAESLRGLGLVRTRA